MAPSEFGRKDVSPVPPDVNAWGERVRAAVGAGCDAQGAAPIVVTGAGGFIGREICRRLLQSDRATHAILRARGLEDVGAGSRLLRTFIADLGAPPALEPLLAGASAIVHLAGRVHHRIGDERRADELYERENVKMTLRLAEAAAAVGVERFVFISSIKALGEQSGPHAFARTVIPRPMDAYGRSKLAAERALAELAGRTRLKIVVIRTPLVYGSEATANFRELVRWVRRGIPLPLAGVHNRRSLISVWNLADFVLHCLGPLPDSFNLFHVSDGPAVSTPELIRAVADGLGVPARLFSAPAIFVQIALQLVGGRALRDRLCGSLEMEVADSFAAANWSPRITFHDGIVRAVRGMSC